MKPTTFADRPGACSASSLAAALEKPRRVGDSPAGDASDLGTGSAVGSTRDHSHDSTGDEAGDGVSSESSSSSGSDEEEVSGDECDDGEVEESPPPPKQLPGMKVVMPVPSRELQIERFYQFVQSLAMLTPAQREQFCTLGRDFEERRIPADVFQRTVYKDLPRDTLPALKWYMATGVLDKQLIRRAYQGTGSLPPQLLHAAILESIGKKRPSDSLPEGYPPVKRMRSDL
eukprot:m51a1_g12801 hypothetical protein (230) ;mRNA; r:541-1689